MVAIKGNKFIWIAVTLFLLFYFIFNPIDYGWMPQCIFHKVTGLQCIGCGSQRVLHSLLHGDVSGALKANALLVVALPFLLFLLWIELSRKKYPRFYRKIHSLPVIIGMSAILIGWLFVRNLYGL